MQRPIPATLLPLLLLAVASPAVRADDAATKPAPAARRARQLASATDSPVPTLADFHYGEHERQVLDFYRAPGETPRPVVFYIHGGGWQGGDKRDTKWLPMYQQYLNAGVSVVSINYRFVPQAAAAKVQPPVSWPLHDAARALQTLRYHAAEWNVDPQRIAASGSSAGACSSLWLAFHDDLADPQSDDPISRQSTRLLTAAVTGAQTTLDPQQMIEWTPNSKYGGHAFGFAGDKAQGLSQFAEFLARRDEILPWIAEYSPYALVSSDDPPVYLIYTAAPALGQDQPDPTHTSNFGVKLRERLQEAGVACELVYPRAAGVRHASQEQYLIDVLTAKN